MTTNLTQPTSITTDSAGAQVGGGGSGQIDAGGHPVGLIGDPRNSDQRLFSEATLHQVTGLKSFRARRHLPDWALAQKKNAAGDYTYGRDDFLRVLRLMGLLDDHDKPVGFDLPTLLDQCAVRPPTTPPVPVEKLPPLLGKVTARQPINPQILLVLLDNDQTIKVKVRTRENFLQGMVVPVVPTRDPQIWELACRLPRFPGRF